MDTALIYGYARIELLEQSACIRLLDDILRESGPLGYVSSHAC